jgi:hypothetical protein
LTASENVGLADVALPLPSFNANLPENEGNYMDAS